MAVVRVDALRSLAFGGISGTYAVVGGPTTHAMRIFRVINNTNGDLLISFDGTTDNLFVPANSFVLYDCETNAQTSDINQDFLIGIGTQIYAKQSTAPTSGSVYVEFLFARGD